MKPTSPAAEEVILAYAAIWSEASFQRIQELVEFSLAPHARIDGPGYQFTGHAAIAAEARRFSSEQPGWRAVLASGIDSHNNTARFGIAMVAPDETTPQEGEDIVFFGDDGRIERVITFWGRLPAVPLSWPASVCVPRRDDA